MMKFRQSRSAMWGRHAATLCALFLSACVSFAGPNKMSPDLGLTASGNIDVIIQFNHVPNSNDHRLVSRHGGTLKHGLGNFHGAVYTISAGQLAELASDSNIKYVSPNRAIKGTS